MERLQEIIFKRVLQKILHKSYFLEAWEQWNSKPSSRLRVFVGGHICGTKSITHHFWSCTVLLPWWYDKHIHTDTQTDCPCDTGTQTGPILLPQPPRLLMREVTTSLIWIIPVKPFFDLWDDQRNGFSINCRHKLMGHTLYLSSQFPLCEQKGDKTRDFDFQTVSRKMALIPLLFYRI